MRLFCGFEQSFGDWLLFGGICLGVQSQALSLFGPSTPLRIEDLTVS